jgi:hypothetical protein
LSTTPTSLATPPRKCWPTPSTRSWNTLSIWRV